MVPCFGTLMILQPRALQNHMQNKALVPDKISKGVLVMNVIFLVRLGSRIILFQDEPVRKGARNQESPAFLTSAGSALPPTVPRAPTSQFQKQSKPLTLNLPTSTEAKALSSRGYGILWPEFIHSLQNPREEWALQCAHNIPE